MIYAKRVLLNPFFYLILLICSTNYYQWRMAQNYQFNEQVALEKKYYLDSPTYKSEEMLRPVVKLDTLLGSGSGVIIYKDTNTYYIITNYHVVNRRLSRTLHVDGLRGISSYTNEDITIQYFNKEYLKVGNKPTGPFVGKIIAKSEELDLAILTFESEQPLNVARLASPVVINNIDVFDSVYAVGCQLAIYPMPTKGIISRIINEKYFVGFNNSAQITPGSSGGGVFKLYKDHYYLIGISNKAAVNYYQVFSHYAYAISTKSIYKFLHNSDLEYILD